MEGGAAADGDGLQTKMLAASANLEDNEQMDVNTLVWANQKVVRFQRKVVAYMKVT